MKAKLTGHAPVLMGKDVEHSANWYKEKLGFEIAVYYGEPRNFAIIQRDSNYVMFWKCPSEKIYPNLKQVEKPAISISGRII